MIIRETRRMDSYPDLDDRLRPVSSWSKEELKGTYHRGIEVFAGIEKVRIEDGVARRAPDNPEAETVWLMGRIPYDAIDEIDWSGDEYNPVPHLYCRYRGWLGRNGPSESIALYRRRENPEFFEPLEYVRWGEKRQGLFPRWRDRGSMRAAEREARARMESTRPNS